MSIDGYSIDKKSIKDYHQGKNLQRIRSFFGLKQEVLAIDLGVSQAKVSHIEKQPVIEEDLLQKVADVLGVSTEIIKKFDVERAIQNINNSAHTVCSRQETMDSSPEQRFDPMEKVVELYERLLKSEREKLELLMKHQKQIQ